MSIQLSRRLQAIASRIPADARVIDVGTDHAKLPVWLVQTGRSPHVWASDIRSGPLDGAKRLIDEQNLGSSVELRLTDGLLGFSADDCDAVVIAGMGGDTIVSILSRAPWVRAGKTLVLSPHTKPEILRRWMIENGFLIASESLVCDGGHIYPILTAAGGVPPSYTEAELRTGLFSQIAGDELFGDLLDRLILSAGKAAPYNDEEAALRTAYLNMKERLEAHAHGI